MKKSIFFIFPAIFFILATVSFGKTIKIDSYDFNKNIGNINLDLQKEYDSELINKIHLDLNIIDSKLEVKGNAKILKNVLTSKIVDRNKDFNIIFSKNNYFMYNKNNNTYEIQGKNIKNNQLKNIDQIEFTFKKTILNSEYNFISKDSISINHGLLPDIINSNKTILSISLPKDYKAIINGYNSIKKETLNDKVIFIFELNKNIKDTHLFASHKYTIKSKKINNIEFITAFFSEHKNLSDDFINKSYEFITNAERKFETKYPYKQFIIIEDESSLGYAIESAIAFSNQIISMPFIITRSLSHEILHQWFGNSIKCNMNDGNWLEAITTFYSDYELSESKEEYRKNILSSFNAISEQSPYSLSKFEGNFSRKDQTIGYGKGVMVLYMAQKIVGEERFLQGIKDFIKDKTFSNASWKDLLSYIGVNEEFYKFWIYNKKNININIKNLEYKNNKLTLDFIRKNGSKEIKIPYTIKSDNKTIDKVFISKIGSTKFSEIISDNNSSIYIDSKYEIMRNLFINEIEPTFMYLYGMDSVNFIGNKEDNNDFQKEFKNIKKFISIENLRPKHIQNQNLIISMNQIVPESVAKYFIPYISFSPEIGRKVYKIIQNPYSNGDKFVLLILNYNKLTLKKIKHYGNYSNLVFNTNDKLEEKEKTKSNLGILVYNNKMYKGDKK